MLVEAVGGPRVAGRVRERSGNIVGLDVHGQGGGAPGILESFLMLSRQLPLPTHELCRDMTILAPLLDNPR